MLVDENSYLYKGIKSTRSDKYVGRYEILSLLFLKFSLKIIDHNLGSSCS